MADTVRAIRSLNPDVTSRCSYPICRGSVEALETVLSARPDVMNHNVEMVEELYDTIRPQAIYQRSLDVLRNSKRIAPDI